jgi:hypothetical protein
MARRDGGVIKATSRLDPAARQAFVACVSKLVRADLASELFDLFSEIALLPYEEAGNTGLLLLAPPNSHPPLLTLGFEAPFSLRNLRGVRKMLQVSNHRLSLLCDGCEVPGFAALRAGEPGALTVQFYPHGMWELREGESVVVQICAGGDAARAGGLERDAFIRAAQAVFKGLSEQETGRLWDLISIAARQLRGTNVLICAEAAAEAARLGTQCTRIKPAVLNPMLMERVTSIDGTVIIDTQGVCHAIGAILDGPAAERGDRTRGGRYNSAVMYVDSSSFPCMIVVVSQDGTVDLVSSPRIDGA